MEGTAGPDLRIDPAYSMEGQMAEPLEEQQSMEYRPLALVLTGSFTLVASHIAGIPKGAMILTETT